MVCAVSDPFEQLLFRAARYTDRRAWEELSLLFVEEGRLIRPSDPANPILGRASILASLCKRPPRTTRHLISNVIITQHSATTASISSLVTLFSGAEGTGKVGRIEKMAIGNFDDEVLWCGDAWRFLERGGSISLESDI